MSEPVLAHTPRRSSLAHALALCLLAARLAHAQEPAAEPSPATTDAPPTAPAPVPESAPSAAPEATPLPAAPEPSPAAAPAAQATPAAPVESAASSAAPAGPASEQQPEISGAPGRGVTVRYGDTFSLNLKSRIQLRYQLNVPPGSANRDPEQLLSVGTVRLSLSGNVLSPELTYVIQLALAERDYRDGATSPVYDAYFDYALHRDVGLRVGQYFVPFDRLRTIREWALQMADRPRPVSELTLDRDVGVTLYSERFLGDHSPVAYRLGAFGGGGTNLTAGREPGALVVGRVELRPLGAIDDDKEGDLERREKPALALGAAFAANWNTNRLRSTTGPTFAGGTTDYLHAAADLVFKWRGWALEAEYLWKKASDDTIVSTADDGSTLVEPTRSAHGWVAQTSYVFDPPIEVVARLSRMYALSGTDPALVKELDARAQEVGAGINYYVSDHRFKLQADWIARMSPDFEIGEAEHAVHLQLDVTL